VCNCGLKMVNGTGGFHPSGLSGMLRVSNRKSSRHVHVTLGLVEAECLPKQQAAAMSHAVAWQERSADRQAVSVTLLMLDICRIAITLVRCNGRCVQQIISSSNTLCVNRHARFCFVIRIEISDRCVLCKVRA
jgi:hypothetical protein